MRTVRASTVVAGVGLMAFAVHGVVADAAITNPPALARWVVGSALVHDIVLGPAVAAGAAVLHRWAPRWWGGPVTVALALTGLFALVALPLVGRFGGHPGNPSALPRDYGTNLLVLAAVVWASAGLVVAARTLRPAWRPAP